MPKGVFLFQKPERDRRILEELRDGRTNPEIARALGLTHGTVRIYVSELLIELDASTRTDAVMRAIALGRIEAPARAPVPRVRRPKNQITIPETRKRK